MASKVRLSVCLNSGVRRGQPEAVIVTPAETEAILTAAANKLRLKKKDVGRARMFVWSTGAELARHTSVAGVVSNGDLIALSLGEAFLGPGGGSRCGERKTASVDSADGSDGCERMPAPPPPPPSLSSHWLRWERREGAGSLAVVEWSDAASMNATLGRMSTLLEHPRLCSLETGELVGHNLQRTLPSSKYLGHNLYAPTLLEFEQLACIAAAAHAREPGGDASPHAGHVKTETLINAADLSGVTSGATAVEHGASAAERAFLETWRKHGAPQVVISFVSGELATLRHELCHESATRIEPRALPVR